MCIKRRGVPSDVTVQDRRDDGTEVHPEIAVGLAHRHGDVRHHPDQHLVNDQAPGPEADELGQRQAADVAHLEGVGEGGLDVLGPEHGRERKDGARQARFDAGIPGPELSRVGMGGRMCEGAIQHVLAAP